MKILIFGITGSIGMQSLEVITKLKNFNLVGFSFFKNEKLAASIALDFPNACIFSPINNKLNSVSSYEDLINNCKPDLIINAISGFAGLEISLLALKHKIKLGLANKESMVVAGKFLNELSKKNKVAIIPIDSELTSLFSLFNSKKNDLIKKIIITASGGNYFNSSALEMNNAKFAEVIKHPKWKMGAKISLDSSTMINKYFEMIELSYYFDYEIDVVQHSQAIVHSMIVYQDGSVEMKASQPKMQLAIQNVLTDFQTYDLLIDHLEFDQLHLSFSKIDENKWLPIKWAKEFFINKNLAQPIIINAANDALFELFKNDLIKFDEIIKYINQAIKEFNHYNISNVEAIYQLNILVDQWVRNNINGLC
ncbi:MAG: 1-deoxy-D-xylulose-5-phosphate reductoisomerase [Mycoplasmoidaceae bacterium]